MADIPSSWTGLSDPDPEARKRNLRSLRELVARGQGDGPLAEAIPALAALAAEPQPEYVVLELLAIADGKGIDLRPALPALSGVAEIPGYAGLRELAKRILVRHPEASTLLTPLPGLQLSEGYSLLEVNRRQVLLSPSDPPPPVSAAGLPCGVCGTGKTRRVAEEHFGAFGNTGGVIDDRIEVLCGKCGNYTIYRYQEDVYN